MFLVMFVLPQILLLGDKLVERTRFQLRTPGAGAVKSMSGTVYLNGRVRGRISGVVDANIHGVVHGDVSALIGAGAIGRPEQENDPEEEHNDEETDT